MRFVSILSREIGGQYATNSGGGNALRWSKQRQQIWANELALIHAKYLAQAILDNSKYAREACAVGKGAHNRSSLLSDNDAARPWGSG